MTEELQTILNQLWEIGAERVQVSIHALRFGAYDVEIRGKVAGIMGADARLLRDMLIEGSWGGTNNRLSLSPDSDDMISITAFLAVPAALQDIKDMLANWNVEILS